MCILPSLNKVIGMGLRVIIYIKKLLNFKMHFSNKNIKQNKLQNINCVEVCVDQRIEMADANRFESD